MSGKGKGDDARASDALKGASDRIKRKQEEAREKAASNGPSKTLREDEDPETVSMNERISQFASRKQLREAVSCFEQALQQGLANQHTYSCTMNAYVRCGDLKGAERVFQQSQDAGHPLEVVACTTMVKGYCEQGDLATALTLINDMEAAKPLVNGGVPPLINIRTVNTFLRGCIGAGAVEVAVSMLERLFKWKLTPDASSFDYVIGLVAQGLQLERAAEILKTSGNRNCLSVMQYLSVVRAAALLGQWATAGGYLTKADAMLAKEAHATGLDTTNHKEGSNTGGKRAKKEMAEERTKSLEAFVEHRAAELKTEAASLRGYINAHKHETKTGTRLAQCYQRLLPFNFPGDEAGEGDPLHCGACQRTFAKETVFTAHLTGKKHLGALKGSRHESAKALPPQLTASLVASYGLEECLWQVSQEAGAGAKDKPRQAREVPLRVAEATAAWETKVDLNGHVDFGAVFGAAAGRPLKLEICSGSGEWAVEQAAADPASDWATLEYRSDRVFQTFTRMAMRRTPNLCVMAGDASRVLPERLGVGSVEHVFINHPQPPQQKNLAASVGAGSQASHLLTADFFRSIHRVLAPGGKLTLVTDNQWYGGLLLQIVAGLTEKDDSSADEVKLKAKRSFGSIALDVSSGRRIEQEQGGFRLYVGAPGKECGHTVSASSYFDRLWAKEQSTDRYFLALTKLGTAGEAAKEDVASVASLQKGFMKKRKREQDLEEKKKGEDPKKKKKPHTTPTAATTTATKVVGEVPTKKGGGGKKRRTPKKQKGGGKKVAPGSSNCSDAK